MGGMYVHAPKARQSSVVFFFFFFLTGVNRAPAQEGVAVTTSALKIA
jgi:hypothetical protein